MVVEDNELNSEIAQCLLEERGFQVDCVYDGAQATERIRTTSPGTYDVILMDIMMPVMKRTGGGPRHPEHGAGGLSHCTHYCHVSQCL